MKVRPFLVLVLTLALTLFAIGVGGWWLVVRQSPLNLQHRSLSMPEAARFIPRTVPLSLHLLTNPDGLVAYTRVVAPARQRRRAVAAVELLRDGAFAAAGLDYASELADWLGSQTSLALMAPEGPAGPTGWLLAMESRDADGARLFLQRFWQTRSLAGTELQISSYRGMGLISGRGGVAGERARPLATALIHDRLVLVASGRGVLEQALDVSQIAELNQAENPRLAADLQRLGQGIALLTARPDVFADWLGIPAEIGADPDVLGLVAALSPSGRALRLESEIDLRQALPSLQLDLQPPLLSELRSPASSLALIQNPALLLQDWQPLNSSGSPQPASSEQDPFDAGAVAADFALWQRLLAPLLRQSLLGLGGPLPALVSSQDHGPMLWAQQAKGWLLATGSEAPSAAQLQPSLSADGLISAPLLRSERMPLQVWTRLEAAPRQGDADQLQASVAGTRAVQNGVAWWAEGLGVLDAQLEGRQPPKERLLQLQTLGSPLAPLQAALAPEPARRLLALWQPWRLLTGLAGSPLANTIDGLAFSLEAEAATAADAEPALRLRGRLELG
ncbi:MAG: DUF3352 domain-containing protein [Cyanobacteria bacterium]|nr:DUF3352 domain-containing protein [Cyanobacteria bacterium bin.51]